MSSMFVTIVAVECQATFFVELLSVLTNMVYMSVVVVNGGAC